MIRTNVNHDRVFLHYMYLITFCGQYSDFECSNFGRSQFSLSMDLTYASEYFDSTLDESSDSDEPPKRKRRRMNRLRVEQKSFATSEEAKKFVTDKNIWKISSTKDISAGMRVNYRCTAGQYRILECPASLYLLYHSDSDRASLFAIQNDYENHVTDPSRGLPAEVKSFVRRKFDEGITKPNNLTDSIRQEKLTVPLKSKLVSFLQSLRVQKLG